MSPTFNTLSRFVIDFLPRSKYLLISWLQSLSTVILESKKIKSVTVSTFSLPICHEVIGSDAMILVFWTLSFKPDFSLSSFTLIKKLFSFPSPSLQLKLKKEFIGPGSILGLSVLIMLSRLSNGLWTLLSAYGNNNGRIRPPLDRETLKIVSRLLIT